MYPKDNTDDDLAQAAFDFWATVFLLLFLLSATAAALMLLGLV